MRQWILPRVLILMITLAACGEAGPAATLTPNATPTLTPVASPTVTITPTPRPMLSPPLTPTPTQSPQLPPTPTSPATPTSPRPTATSAAPTPTATLVPGVTPTWEVKVDSCGGSIAGDATIHTNKGDIVIEFFDEEAPNTVDNFVGLARRGFYDGVIFYRAIKDFMIQGVTPPEQGQEGPATPSRMSSSRPWCSTRRGFWPWLTGGRTPTGANSLSPLSPPLTLTNSTPYLAV